MDALEKASFYKLNSDTLIKRQRLLPHQLEEMKIQFAKKPYLSNGEVEYLSAKLNIEKSKIKIWFGNRRKKIKKLKEVKLSKLNSFDYSRLNNESSDYTMEIPRNHISNSTFFSHLNHSEFAQNHYYSNSAENEIYDLPFTFMPTNQRNLMYSGYADDPSFLNNSFMNDCMQPAFYSSPNSTFLPFDISTPSYSLNYSYPQIPQYNPYHSAVVNYSNSKANDVPTVENSASIANSFSKPDSHNEFYKHQSFLNYSDSSWSYPKNSYNFFYNHGNDSLGMNYFANNDISLLNSGIASTTSITSYTPPSVKNCIVSPRIRNISDHSNLASSQSGIL